MFNVSLVIVAGPDVAVSFSWTSDTWINMNERRWQVE